MLFAEAIQEKLEDISSLHLDRLQLTNGELPEKQRNAVLKAVHEVTAGSTLTELYRELGIIKPPGKPAYHPPNELSPEEQAAALEKQAEEAAQAILTDTELLISEQWKFLSDATRKQLNELWLSGTTHYRKTRPKKSKKPVKKGAK
jgi:hypothetical protein